MAVRFAQNPMMERFGPVRFEAELRDCEVEGEVPSGLDGGFYRVGPDFQYPPRFAHNIPFDGEGHVSLFRFANGHVDYRSRYVRTQRFKAQADARRALFGMYRNPYSDDPVVAAKKLSRGTANTQIVFHHGKLLALKEDSPPVAMDPNTLETLDDYYTFGGKYAALAHTAHPKIDSETGELVGYGYGALGEMSNDVYVYSADARGTINWETWVKVPYVGMLHDFAVTRRHIAFLVIPMVTSVEQMKRGGVRFAWDSKLPSWFGFMRRGGDGSDLRWYRGPERCATHVMGAFSDGDRVFVDMDMAHKNQFPFFPNAQGEPFDPVGASGRITRLTVNPERRSDNYEMDVLFGESGVLPRQDDRYHTVPYRYGYMPTLDMSRPLDERLAQSPMRPLNCYTRFDQTTRKTSSYFVGPVSGLQECCFVPRRRGAPEGDGYLVGIASRLLEGRSDLVILDASELEAGPVATVKLPFRTFGQIHGWWVGGEHLRPPA